MNPFRDWTPEKVRLHNERVNKACGGIPHAEQCERSAQLDSGDERETQSPRGVQVSFTLYRVRTLDVDAKYGSVKDLLDCVVHAGFVAGDKEGQVDLEVRQVKVRTVTDERTEVEIICPCT